MPTALHPQAKFDPIPPDLDLHTLVAQTPNFKWVQRVSRAQIRNLGAQEFEKLVLIHVILGGKPLVIDGWNTTLPSSIFNVDWLERTYDKKGEYFAPAQDLASASYLSIRGKCTRSWRGKRHSHDHGSLFTIHAAAHQPMVSY
jgi:hypothetical protein